MSTDLLQQAWRADSSRTRLTVRRELMLKQVQQHQTQFRAMIFLRDFRELVSAAVMIPVWFVLGAVLSLPWSWYLGVLSFLWIIGFVLVDRKRHPQRLSRPDEPLVPSIQASLSQVNHQIWLLRNVFWWYLLPGLISSSVFFVDVGWRRAESMSFTAALMAFVLLVNRQIERLNQRAIRTDLEPRRQELLGLLRTLGEGAGLESEAEPSEVRNAKDGGMMKSWIVLIGLVLVPPIVFEAGPFVLSLFQAAYDGPAISSGPEGKALASLITDLRKERRLVGLAAMVRVDGQVTANAAVGERMIGKGVPLGLEDRWHLGSITKSITSTMIGRLIEAGAMDWSDTVGQRFPDAKMHEDWKGVTLEQLMTHTAGAPPNFSLKVKVKRPEIGPECTKERQQAVREVIAVKPLSTPGEKHAYSNVGYTIAGAMAEQATGLSWEELVKREVFEPLKLASAGFGPPKSPLPALDQPRGHKLGLGKSGASDTADNTPIMGPAGTVHMTLADLTAYATEHLRGELGAGTLLKTETFQRLHRPRLNGYGCGWVLRKASGPDSKSTYWHNGSNTMWYALVVFIPETKTVIAVTSNDGDIKSAEAAAWEIVNAFTSER